MPNGILFRQEQTIFVDKNCENIQICVDHVGMA